LHIARKESQASTAKEQGPLPPPPSLGTVKTHPGIATGRMGMELRSMPGTCFTAVLGAMLLASYAESIELKFDSSNLLANNLGGKGPVFTDDPMILYGDVAEFEGKMLALRVTNKSEYSVANSAFNGLSGMFGEINVQSASSVDLTFCLLDQDTMDPVAVDHFDFTFVDLDTGNNHQRVEEVVASGFVGDFTLMENDLLITDVGDIQRSYKATVVGTLVDNPTDPMALTNAQMRKAFTLMFMGTPCFDVTFLVSGPANFFGRNFLFAGSSILVEPLCKDICTGEPEDMSCSCSNFCMEMGTCCPDFGEFCLPVPENEEQTEVVSIFGLPEGTDACMFPGITCDVLTGSIVGLDVLTILENGGTLGGDGMRKLQGLEGVDTAPTVDITFDEFLELIKQFKFLIKLDVSCLGFEGTLNESIGELCNLEELDVSFNLLTGNIQAIRSLVKLRVLRLDHNLFTGIVPAENLELFDLEIVNLSFNQLEGRVEGFAAFEKLREFRATNNMIAGFLPKFSSKFDLVLALDNNFLIGGLGMLGMSDTIAVYGKSIRAGLVGNNCICGEIPETLEIPSTYGTSLGVVCDMSTDPCIVGQGFVIEDNQPSGELAHNTLQLLLGLAVDDATVVLIEENNYVAILDGFITEAQIEALLEVVSAPVQDRIDDGSAVVGIIIWYFFDNIPISPTLVEAFTQYYVTVINPMQLCPLSFKSDRVLVALQQYIIDVLVASGVAMNEGAVEIKAFSPFELSDDSYETCIEFSGATSGLGEMLGKRLRALLEDESNTYKVFFSNETAAMVFDELMIDYYNHPFYNEGDGVVPEPGPDQGRRMLFNRRKLLGGGCGNAGAYIGSGSQTSSGSPSFGRRLAGSHEPPAPTFQGFQSAHASTDGAAYIGSGSQTSSGSPSFGRRLAGVLELPPPFVEGIESAVCEDLPSIEEQIEALGFTIVEVNHRSVVVEEDASCDELVLCDESDVLPECVPEVVLPVSPPPNGMGPPPPMAAVKSDPHFMALDGHTFDFNGLAGHAYSILSSALDDNLQVIARFGVAYSPSVSFDPAKGTLVPYKRKGTWISSLAFATGDAARQVVAVATTKQHSAVGELPLAGEGLGIKLNYGSVMTYNMTHADGGVSVQVRERVRRACNRQTQGYGVP